MTKSQARTEPSYRFDVDVSANRIFDIRNSGFFRHSSFGIRHSTFDIYDEARSQSGAVRLSDRFQLLLNQVDVLGESGTQIVELDRLREEPLNAEFFHALLHPRFAGSGQYENRNMAGV